MKHTPAILIVLALAIPVAAQDTKAPDIKPPQPVAEASTTPPAKALDAHLRQAIEAHAADLSSDEPAKRQAAHDAIKAILLQAPEQLLQAIDASDPEQVRQTEALLDTARQSLLAAQVQASLDNDDDRQAFRELRSEHPQKVADLFSRDPQLQIQAVRDLGPQGRGGDVILRWACRQPAYVVRIAAYETAAKRKNLSQPLQNAIFGRLRDVHDPAILDLVDNNRRQWADRTLQIGAESERRAIATAMATANDCRIIPWLLGDIVTSDMSSSARQDRTDAVELLSKFRDKRAVATLLPHLDGNGRRLIGGSHNKKPYTVDALDYILAAAIDLSGQKRSTYNMGVGNKQDYMKLAFYDDADRMAAIKKFKTWYKDNAEDFKDVKPYAVPDANQKK